MPPFALSDEQNYLTSCAPLSRFALPTVRRFWKRLPSPIAEQSFDREGFELALMELPSNAVH